MSSRRNERAEYKSRRAQDKEWWKPLSLLPEKVRLAGRRLSAWLTKHGTADADGSSDRGQVDGTMLAWLLAGLLAFYAGWYAWQGLKFAGHQVKCGIVRVFTSDRCAPRVPAGPPPNPLEGVEFE